MANNDNQPFVNDHYAMAASDQSAELRSNFGRALHNARVAMGLSRQEVEALTGVSEDELAEIEIGHSDPALATLAALAKALRRDLWELLA